MKLKTVYIFNFLAVLIIIVFTIVYLMFKDIKNMIIESNYNSNINYITDISQNLVNELKPYLYIKYLKNRGIREKLENQLSLFITDRYKYIYVVEKTGEEFRFLLDGSKDDKAIFLESYEPIELEKWNKVYKTKKDIYFTHKNIETLWITYLKPIIINNEVKAILVIDFSMEEHSKIETSLNKLNNIFEFLIYFFIFIFVVFVWFSIIDLEKEKELSKLNRTLENRVKEEIEKNRQKDEQLLYQSKLAQMGEMLSMIAHQWRQPLSAISANAISVKFKAQLKNVDNQFLISKMEKISNYVVYLSNTIEDFRNFFKPTKQKELVSYDEIIKSVLEIIGVILKNRDIKLQLNIDYKDKILVFSNELKQVILNLIKNAEDILVENNIPHKKIFINVYKKDKKIVFRIEDNGGGIDEKIFNKIFEPYFSTKDSKNGTGLGLYMSKIIVEKHLNGELVVYNSNNGAVFEIILDIINKDKND